MGKRKTKKVQLSRTQLLQKRRGKPDKEFLCYYCQHEKSVAVKIDNQSGVGLLNCRTCGVKFSTRVTLLDEAIDVYAVWMDVCREGQLAEPSSKIRDTVNHKIPQDIGSSTVDPSKIVPIKLATYGSDISGTATGEDYVDTTIQSKSHNHDVITKFINDDVISPVFSRISGGTRRKRIIDAVDDTNYIPEFTAGGMAEDSLFEDD